MTSRFVKLTRDGVTRLVRLPLAAGGDPGSGGTGSGDTTRMMWASRGLCPPHWSHAASSGQVISVSEVIATTPDYASTKLGFSWSNFWTLHDGTANPERDNTNPITVSATVKVGTGPWIDVAWGGQSSVVIAPGATASADAVIPGGSIAASTPVRIKTKRVVTAGQTSPGGYRVSTDPNQSHAVGVRYTSDNATADALMHSDAPPVDNSSGQAVYYYGPDQMLADGWDGRAVALVVGDSIGFGGNSISYIVEGLEGTTGGLQKTPLLNLCVQGTRPSEQATTNPGQYQRRIQVITAARAFDGSNRIPATVIHSEMGVNSLTNDLTQFTGYMTAWWDFLRAQLPGLHLVQGSLTPKTTNTSGAWTTYAGQTPVTDCRWDFNAALPGHLAAGRIDKLVELTAAWVGPSPENQKWIVPGFTTTLAGATAAGATIMSLVDSPPLGGYLMVDPAGTPSIPFGSTDSVAGTGPFVVSASNMTQAHPIGTPVVLAVTRDGIHPGRPATTAAAVLIRQAKAGGKYTA